MELPEGISVQIEHRQEMHKVISFSSRLLTGDF